MQLFSLGEEKPQITQKNIHRLTQIHTDWMIETADFADSAEKICANLCNLWFLSLASSAPLFPLRLCVTLGDLRVLGALGVPIHRLTQIYTDWMIETADFADSAEKSVPICVICGFFFMSSAPLFPLRPCVTLGALRVLGALGVPIHRLTQICTDWMIETADFADSAEKSVLICVICGFFFVSSAPLFPLRPCVTLGALRVLGDLGIPIH